MFRLISRSNRSDASISFCMNCLQNTRSWFSELMNKHRCVNCHHPKDESHSLVYGIIRHLAHSLNFPMHDRKDDA